MTVERDQALEAPAQHVDRGVGQFAGAVDGFPVRQRGQTAIEVQSPVRHADDLDTRPGEWGCQLAAPRLVGMPVHPDQGPPPLVQDHDIAPFNPRPIPRKVHDGLNRPAKLSESGDLGLTVRIPQAPHEEGVADHEARITGEHLAERVFPGVRGEQGDPVFGQDSAEIGLLFEDPVLERRPRLGVVLEFVGRDQPAEVLHAGVYGVAGVVDERRS